MYWLGSSFDEFNSGTPRGTSSSENDAPVSYNTNSEVALENVAKYSLVKCDWKEGRN